MKVNWLIKCNYPFKELECMPGNPLDEGQPITKSHNGQELPFNMGNYLCHLILK